MKYKILLFLSIIFISCQQKREVNISFYYWKTAYNNNSLGTQYLDKLKCKRLYLRIMDIDLQTDGTAVPVAPIIFNYKTPENLQLIPTIFLVNELLKNQNEAQLSILARRMLSFVDAKIKQAGKNDYPELQIDCDWTATTRRNYFSLLTKLKKLNGKRKLSSTLRLHQLKNQLKSGIPPVDQVMLMCYNMGNLRQYGTKNSILDVAEFKKYADQNLRHYPIDIAIALPLFSWAVVFDNGNYAGISKKLKITDLQNKTLFQQQKNGLFFAKRELPELGIRKNWEIRFEDSKLEDIIEIADFLSAKLPKKPLNLVYYHLDEELLTNYPLTELEKVNRIFY